MEGKKATTQATGANGEQLAELFLLKKGYQVLERNYRYIRAEIDLILQKDNLMVFVEVKTRKNKAFGNPEEFVSQGQAERIMAAAEHFLIEKGWKYHIRFDIVAITLNPQTEILHLEDAIA